MEQLTKEDLVAALEGVAKAADLANVEHKIDALSERVNELADLTALREKVDRMRDVLREKLGVEV